MNPRVSLENLSTPGNFPNTDSASSHTNPHALKATWEESNLPRISPLKLCERLCPKSRGAWGRLNLQTFAKHHGGEETHDHLGQSAPTGPGPPDPRTSHSFRHQGKRIPSQRPLITPTKKGIWFLQDDWPPAYLPSQAQLPSQARAHEYTHAHTHVRARAHTHTHTHTHKTCFHRHHL